MRIGICLDCKEEKPIKSRGMCPRCWDRRYRAGEFAGSPRGKPKAPLGSTRINTFGYVIVKTDKGWIHEHRVIMAKELGRALLSSEKVVHRNGVRDDNRLENLELKSGRKKRPASGYKLAKTADGWLPEHRVVMEQMLGRPLLSTESVHHKNGIKDDNRPENLELWCGVGAQPTGVRLVDLIEFVVRDHPDLVFAAIGSRSDFIL